MMSTTGTLPTLAARTSTTIQELPDPAILRILQLVPEKQRLSCCALVSMAWAAAARAATTEISTSVPGMKFAAFSAWLQEHGQLLTSICVKSEGDVGYDHTNFMYSNNPSQLPVLELPPALVLPNLVRLDCRNMQLHIQPQASTSTGSSHQGSVVAATTMGLPRLRELRLSHCRVAMSDLGALQLPQLTKLVLDSLCPPLALTSGSVASTPPTLAAINAEFDRFKQQSREVVPVLLQRLPQLLELQLRDFIGLVEGDLATISNLQRLQDCRITCCVWAGPSLLQGLCSSLTALELEAGTNGGSTPLTTGHMPAHGWPHLRRLHFDQVEFDPAVLYGLQHLLHLKLDYCTLLGGDGYRVSVLCCVHRRVLCCVVCSA